MNQSADRKGPSVGEALRSARRHAQARLFLATAARFRERRWPAPLTRISPGELVVTGFVNEVMGLGRAAVMTVEALTRAGMDPFSHDLRPALSRVSRGGLPLPGGPGGVWLLVANPPECYSAWLAYRPRDWVSRYRIGYWVWETSEAPPEWVRHAARLHEIWTPSRYSEGAIAAAFRRAGRPELAAKLRVMPHPAPRLAPTPNRARFGLPFDAMLTLASFDGRSTYARKNPEGALAAWLRAFPAPQPDVHLVIKAVEPEADPAGWRRLMSIVNGRADVTVIAERLDDVAMVELLSSVDIVLTLARAEGFGLPIAEAMALGKVAIAPAYSAPLEFTDPSCALLVPTKEAPVNDPAGVYRQGAWGEPDIDAAAEALRRAHADPALRDRIGRNAKVKLQALDAVWTADALAEQPWAKLVVKA